MVGTQSLFPPKFFKGPPPFPGPLNWNFKISFSPTNPPFENTPFFFGGTIPGNVPYQLINWGKIGIKPPTFLRS